MLDRERPWLELDLLAGPDQDAAWARLALVADVVFSFNDRMRAGGWAGPKDGPSSRLEAIVRDTFGGRDPALLVDAARPETRRDFQRLVAWAWAQEAAPGVP